LNKAHEMWKMLSGISEKYATQKMQAMPTGTYTIYLFRVHVCARAGA